MENKDRVQWRMCFFVLHGPSFGHKLEISTATTGRDSMFYEAGSWRGIGIPATVLRDARAIVDAILTEHLETRYGVQEELPLKSVDGQRPV